MGEFADRLYCANPLARREISTAVRGKRVFAILTGIALIGAAITIFFAMSAHANVARAAAQTLGMNLFRLYVWFLFAATALTAPALAAGSICNERTNGSLDFLRVTNLSDAQVFLAKLAAPLYLVLLTLLTSLPILLSGRILGGYSLNEILSVNAVIFAMGLFGGCTGLLISSLINRFDTAVVLTYLVLMGYLFGTGYGPDALVARYPQADLWGNVLNPVNAVSLTLRPGIPPTVYLLGRDWPLWLACSSLLVSISLVFFLLGLWRLHKEPLVLVRYFRFGRRNHAGARTSYNLFGLGVNAIFLRDYQCGLYSGSYFRVVGAGVLLAVVPALLDRYVWPAANQVFAGLYLLVAVPIVVGLGASSIGALRERGLLTHAVLTGMPARQVLRGKAGSSILVPMPFLLGGTLSLILSLAVTSRVSTTQMAGMQVLEHIEVADIGTIIAATMVAVSVAGAMLAFLWFWVSLALSRSIREPTAGRAITSTFIIGLFYTGIGFVLGGCFLGIGKAITSSDQGGLIVLAVLGPVFAFIWAIPWMYLGEKHLADTARMMDRLIERYDYASTS